MRCIQHTTSLGLLSVFVYICGTATRCDAQSSSGPQRTSRAISILGDHLYLHGGSTIESANQEPDCSPDLFRLFIGRTNEWNITESSVSGWELVEPPYDPKNVLGRPPAAGLGLTALPWQGFNTNETISPQLTKAAPKTVDDDDDVLAEGHFSFLVEFGRLGCANESSSDGGGKDTSAIGFNIYDKYKNIWKTIDFEVTDPATNTSLSPAEWVKGNWQAPVVLLDPVTMTWHIILQSSTPLRQVIISRSFGNMDGNATAEEEEFSWWDFQGRKTILRQTIEFLSSGWTLTSDLNHTAPYVGRGTATFVDEMIVVISGEANSFIPGDLDPFSGDLRACDHAFVFSLATKQWRRVELSVQGGGAPPATREGAAFVTVGKTIVMHGGVKPFETVLNDLWILDTTTWTWTRGPDAPSPRAGHTLIPYHEYLLAVSGFNVGPNVPLTSPLPILAYNTNTSSWTDVVRATVRPSALVSGVTRVMIFILSAIIACALLIIVLAVSWLRRWNLRNYMKVDDEAYGMEGFDRQSGQYPLEREQDLRVRKKLAQLEEMTGLSAIDEETEEDTEDEEDDEMEYDYSTRVLRSKDDQEHLLYDPQPKPKSSFRRKRSVSFAEVVEVRDPSSFDGDSDDDEDSEDDQPKPREQIRLKDDEHSGSSQ
ncbi:hypothetical protein BGW42_000740 [Actinomortierella wolfii]|nr:hypothetical protein BGW42_000740 [Actinomortierella wolfii]